VSKFERARGPSWLLRRDAFALFSVSLTFLLASETLAQSSTPQTVSLIDMVRATIERQPGIKLAEEQVRFVEGSLQSALGAFDVQFGSALSRTRERLPLPSFAQDAGLIESATDSLGVQFEASRLFKSGLGVTSSLRLANRDSNNVPGLENRSRISFVVRQPLLRGRGEGGFAAFWRTVGLERDATVKDLRHAVARSVRETADAYWLYLAQLQRLEIARESEGRFGDLQKSSELLLEAREVAAVDIRQLTANVARRRISRLQGEQAVFHARVRLGLSAGLEATALASLGDPADSFPATETDLVSTTAPVLVEIALSRRDDFRAARLRQLSAGVALGAAQNASRPALDLVLETGYDGLSERGGLPGFLAPLSENLKGPSASASVVFAWPTKNRTALGRLAENRAILRQSEITLADAERHIGARVSLALNNLTQSAARVTAAREACRLFRETLAAERQRLQLGISSVLDVINTEDRLNESLLEAVSADLDYAQSVVALRFETGTLLGSSDLGNEVDLIGLTTPPKATSSGR